jgi:hypothetical protein
MDMTAGSDPECPPDMLPLFLLQQKRREHVQEALLKEIGWNDEVEDPERRGALSVG